VGDGLGGHKAGEVASTFALKRFKHAIEEARYGDRWVWPTNWGDHDFKTETHLLPGILQHAISSAHQFLHQTVRDHPEWRGMGTTIVAAIFSGDHLYFAHVGDSRLYLLRNGVLYQRTEDHSYVQFLVNTGQINAEEAKVHPGRSRLMQSLGGEAISIAHGEDILKPGDRLLLCTDGIHHMLPHERLEQILRQPEASPRQMTQQLIEEANVQGGRDNMAVIVVTI
ncbi:MAG: protein phosphatase 2C domain-containing protein, partial [Chromatiales bacterium]|nr:protein phosphatase 2C domain-containing protein [Chromatiales bacterium]